MDQLHPSREKLFLSAHLRFIKSLEEPACHEVVSPVWSAQLSNGGSLFDSSIRAQSSAITIIERCSGEEVVKRQLRYD